MNIVIASIIAILLLLSYPLFKVAKHVGWSWQGIKKYFSKDGEAPGALGGIKKATLFIVGLLVVAFLSMEVAEAEPQYFPEAYVFAGFDKTKNISPMCEPDGADNRATSDLGVGVVVLRYHTLDVNLERTHHSCAVNEDDKSYDAWGIKARWRFDLTRLFN